MYVSHAVYTKKILNYTKSMIQKGIFADIVWNKTVCNASNGCMNINVLHILLFFRKLDS